MKPNRDYEKCQGEGCAYKHVCHRFVRPSAEQGQIIKPFDKFADDDCAHFESVPKECK